MLKNEKQIKKTGGGATGVVNERELLEALQEFFTGFDSSRETLLLFMDMLTALQDSTALDELEVRAEYAFLVSRCAHLINRLEPMYIKMKRKSITASIEFLPIHKAEA